MKKRLAATAMAAIMAVSSVPSAGALLDGFNANTNTYKEQFTDVPSGAWYHDSIKSAYELGLVNGISNTKFSPTTKISKDQLTVLIARIHSAYYGEPIENKTYDTGGWAQKYYYYVDHHIALDYSREIMNGEDGGVSRFQFAYWLSQALPESAYTAINTVPSGQIYDLLKSDVHIGDDRDPQEGINRIYLLYRAGILTGSNEYGRFKPDDSISRAEVTTIVTRMVDPEKRQKISLTPIPPSGIASYLGKYYTNTDPRRSWIGHYLYIEEVSGDKLGFTYVCANSGRVMLFTNSEGTYVSSNKVIATGTAYYSGMPNTVQNIKYEITFLDKKIHLKITGDDWIKIETNFVTQGTMD